MLQISDYTSTLIQSIINKRETDFVVALLKTQTRVY